MSKKYNYTMPLLFALVVALGMFAGARFQSSYKILDGKPDEKKTFGEVLDLIRDAYVDEPDLKEIKQAGLEAMLLKLDPHSVYIPADELKAANETLEGNFEGVGIEFNILNDTILVVTPISGGPSEKVGVRAGDRIIKIDGKLVAGNGITNADVFKNLRGRKGTQVRVTIKRLSAEKDTINFIITRDKIPLHSLDAAYMAAPNVGYIKINRFSATTTEELKAALSKLRKQGMIHCILDLRGNPGGYLKAAIEMADEFLPREKVVVYTQGRKRKKEIYRSTATGTLESGKIAVLIDEGSASASEIVSGALQDHDRALIVGRRSFGKGLVQEPFMLSDGSGLRLTVARYYTPSGRSIQRSYEEGVDEYYNELNERFEHGEMLNRDSIHLADSIKYYTTNGRIVYGGGGIMPDIFVPIDTADNSVYLQQVLALGLLSNFVQSYMDDNRAALNQSYPEFNTFNQNFKAGDDILNSFISYAKANGVKPDTADIDVSRRYLSSQIKALVARQLFRDDGYYQVVNENNKVYQAALKALKDDTFEELDIKE